MDWGPYCHALYLSLPYTEHFPRFSQGFSIQHQKGGTPPVDLTLNKARYGTTEYDPIVSVHTRARPNITSFPALPFPTPSPTFRVVAVPCDFPLRQSFLRPEYRPPKAPKAAPIPLSTSRLPAEHTHSALASPNGFRHPTTATFPLAVFVMDPVRQNPSAVDT